MAIGKKIYHCIYKVEPLNLQAPTGPPHSTMRQNWNVSFQMWRSRTQRCVVQCRHMIQEILWTKSIYMGWLHSSCLFLGLGCSALCHVLSDPVDSEQSARCQSKVCRRAVSWPHVYSYSSIAGWNEDFAAELRAIYRCKQQGRGAERGVDIAVEESGSKGFTNETILITSHGNERCSVLVVSYARKDSEFVARSKFSAQYSMDIRCQLTHADPVQAAIQAVLNDLEAPRDDLGRASNLNFS